jgi:hypothetical protein
MKAAVTGQGSRVRGVVSVAALVGLATAVAPIDDRAHASHPTLLTLLTQQNSDGTTLPAGAMATTGTVLLSGTSDAATCASTAIYRMEVELQPLTTPFTGTPNYLGPLMTKPSCVAQAYPAITIAGLPPGDYHWQAREMASSAGGWVMFNAGQIAFTTGPAPRLTLSPPSIAFGNQAITGPSAPVTVTITNAGTLTLNVTAANVTGPFAVSGSRSRSRWRRARPPASR